MTVLILGLNMDLLHVLSNNLTPQEEESLKLHREIRERLQTYEKVNRKRGWQVAEINEQVEEQISLRDNIVTKYNTIFASVEHKLEQMELEKTQTTKMRENLIQEREKAFKTQVRSSSLEGTSKVHKECNLLNEVHHASAAFIESTIVRFDEKDRAKKSIENEYYTKHSRSLYEHNKQMKAIKEQGQTMLDTYWDQVYVTEEPGTSKFNGMTRQQVKEAMVDELQQK